MTVRVPNLQSSTFCLPTKRNNQLIYVMLMSNAPVTYCGKFGQIWKKQFSALFGKKTCNFIKCTQLLLSYCAFNCMYKNYSKKIYIIDNKTSRSIIVKICNDIFAHFDDMDI